jgi:hypothetical protein
MDVAKIIDQLTHANGLPKAALRVASAHRVEMVSVFLDAIDSYLALAPTDRAKPNPLFFIFHLLGEWREKSAYRPIARLLRCPSHEVDAILGDATTGTSHRVMAAVYEGDPRPLYDIILDPNADEFIRSRMCEALAMAVLAGELDRDVAGRFLRDAFMELCPQARSFVWNGWQNAIAMLGLSELTILVKRAFDRRFIDPQWLEYRHFVRNLESAIRQPDQYREEFSRFGNTVEELSGWHCFSEEYLNRRDQMLEDADPNYLVDQPYRNPFKGVGRNDRCPCGSGKKFKQCCLGGTVQLQ